MYGEDLDWCYRMQKAGYNGYRRFEQRPIFGGRFADEIGPPDLPEIQPVAECNLGHYDVSGVERAMGGEEIGIAAIRIRHRCRADVRERVAASEPVRHAVHNSAQVRVAGGPL